MKRSLLIFAVIVGLGMASAQNLDTSEQYKYWGGISSGFPFGVTLHAGADDLLAEGASVRFIGSLFGDEVGLGIDALYGFDLEEQRDLELYAGGGPAIRVGNGFALGINAFGGVEYRLSALDFSAGGVFLEVGPYLGFGDDTFLDFNARVGFNYHF